jgi:hypothetical protein
MDNKGRQRARKAGDRPVPYVCVLHPRGCALHPSSSRAGTMIPHQVLCTVGRWVREFLSCSL